MSGGLLSQFLVLSFVAFSDWAASASHDEQKTIEMKMVYRYSEQFQAIKSRQAAAGYWQDGDNRPMGFTRGRLHDHEHLVRRDRVRHARKGLLEGSYSAAPSNETADVEVLGGLHYTYITLGTPGVEFLVALDTGSDLLWVPCDCQQCASTNWATYGIVGQTAELSVYNPSSSNTSSYLACTDSLCSSTLSSGSCTSANEKCNYAINYVSANTSTSGVIIEDLIQLNSEETNGSSTTTSIYFGCGEIQTGDLLEGVAPDGLFGLGPENISVPSTMARNGLIAKNSFSMCFSSSDLSGRLVFGVEAKNGLSSTSLVAIDPSAYYLVAVTKISVNGESLSVSNNFIFDTGTSYTTLPTSTYEALGNIFNEKINLPQYQLNGSFDYCWNTSDSNYLSSFPNLTLVFEGGSTLEITNPYIAFSDSQSGNIEFVCLGIIPSSNAIIGHNFMPGYEFFFDQGALSLSWAQSSCYTLNASTVATPSKNPTIVNRESNESPSSSSAGSFFDAHNFVFVLSSVCTSLILLLLPNFI